MRIAVIGAGNVGGTLGKGWANKGHEVTWGVRDPGDEKIQRLLNDTKGKARVANVAAAVKDTEVAVLTVPYNAAQEAIRSAGDLSGKILLDCTNPVLPDLSGLTIGHTTSAAEQVAAAAPQAKVVKIFNTTGSNNMANPRYPAGALTMLYCGDDAEAKKKAATLASDLGFEPVDAGALAVARLLEPLAMLWITLAFKQGMGVDFGFRLARR
jgi:8-hydroxy-5-deazaflavin:NADPH oxidoreductase